MRLWITALCAGAAIACGGGANPDVPDAADNSSRRLVVLDATAVGLPFGGDSVLRVRYEDVDGFPIPSAPTEFTFLSGDTESTGGASLSETSALTDENGIARISVVAGAERANFRVRANAEDATPVTFFIAVSELGFANVRVTPRHDGFRELSEFARLEMRLYRRSFVRCAQINPDIMPPSVFQPRSLPGFEGSATFDSVGALEPYTLLVWAEVIEAGTPVAVGCVSLGAQQLQPARLVSVEVVVTDRPLALPADADLDSSFDLAPIAAAARDAGATAAWDALACADGPGQLLLDRIVPAAGSEPIAVAVEARRGELDANTGCRPATAAGGAPSLDRVLTEAVAASGGFPTGSALADVTATRRSIAASARLRSSLSLHGPAATHTVRSLQFGTGTAVHDVDLGDSARPVVSARQIPLSIVNGTALSVGEHAFTIRLGRASRAAFVVLGLAPVGLADGSMELGTSLIDAVRADAQTGCEAASALVCDAIESAPSCLEAACGAVAGDMDAELEAWWQLTDTTAIDFGLAGTAPLLDLDDDLAVDVLGADATGTWTVSIATASGTEVATTGTFASEPPVTE